MESDIVCRYGIPVMWANPGWLVVWILWSAQDLGEISSVWFDIFLYSVSAVVGIFVVYSFFVPKIILRIRHYYLLAGIGAFGVLYSVVFESMIYFIRNEGRKGALLFLLIASAVWLVQVLVDAISRVKYKKIIERSYREEEDRFTLPKPINEFNGKWKYTPKGHVIYNWIYIVHVGWAIYEFFFVVKPTMLGTHSFHYFLFTCFGLPIAFYTASRLLQGFYLWIYTPWVWEKRTGKKFMFVEP